MSINIVSEIVHFAGHTARPPASRHWYDLQDAACLVSSADRCSVYSVRACVPVRDVVCLAACAVQAVRVRWGLGSPPAGYIAAAQPRPVSLSTTEKIKKTHPTFTNQNPSDCAILQKFQKIQKDPFRSLDCGIIS